MPVPSTPKIYHIVHVDRLAAIVRDRRLWCDAEVVRRSVGGTTIGMNSIKTRRLEENELASHSGLMVGECVPFYFCPRSVMLYLIHQANHPELAYRGGQVPILHLEADLHRAVEWAEAKGRRWAFTLSNAGSFYFEDRADLAKLSQINWPAVAATKWAGMGVDRSIKEGKQAEFLMEGHFPWELVERIGVISTGQYAKADQELAGAGHRPKIEVKRDWYY